TRKQTGNHQRSQSERTGKVRVDIHVCVY
ncbi:MAG: hypothetical protein ACI9SE_003172, partial [Neolewinella sp.]